jgi:hypothetical protein
MTKEAAACSHMTLPFGFVVCFTPLQTETPADTQLVGFLGMKFRRGGVLGNISSFTFASIIPSDTGSISNVWMNFVINKYIWSSAILLPEQ